MRSYYEVDGKTLVVVRNGLELRNLVGYVVDAKVGQDTTMAGFTADESRIGQQRKKVTIFRVDPDAGTNRHGYRKKLSEILAGR